MLHSLSPGSPSPTLPTLAGKDQNGECGELDVYILLLLFILSVNLCIQRREGSLQESVLSFTMWVLGSLGLAADIIFHCFCQLPYILVNL